MDTSFWLERSKRLLDLSHSTYIDKMLKKFSMEQSKKGLIHIIHGTTLSKSVCPQTQDVRTHMSRIPNASTIGFIMYIMICTRPDVSYVISVMSRYQSDPREGHWVAVKNILKYLKRIKDAFLIYGDKGIDLHVKGYTDASFQYNRDDSKS